MTNNEELVTTDNAWMVTADEAERIVASTVGQTELRRYARTVVALYAEADALRAQVAEAREIARNQVNRVKQLEPQVAALTAERDGWKEHAQMRSDHTQRAIKAEAQLAALTEREEPVGADDIEIEHVGETRRQRRRRERG